MFMLSNWYAFSAGSLYYPPFVLLLHVFALQPIGGLHQGGTATAQQADSTPSAIESPASSGDENPITYLLQEIHKSYLSQICFTFT